ncbi:lipopolysaccharide biosynthesis protein [Actinotalea sp. BY-33]|uniref:Lipopolysaccharide biosynthesis protein n=1 Tax=Actinotalea soli TaxID=2819234 RepID=A0A939RWA7_9CELL|nr:lipopolysaccharide biosynthesis protein [Actinotalea soli]MBO1751991.1 lipopolysaccharide biosynthesis protein [Actinotalea soli]
MTQETESPVSAQGLASGTRWMVMGRLVTQVSRFVVSILLARLLTPEAFGLVAVAMTTILALEVFKDLGTGAAVIQRPEVDQALLSSVFYFNVLAGVVCAAAMFFGAPLIATAFGTPDATSVVRALSVIMVLSGLTQTHHAVLRRSMRFSGVAAVEMAGALVNGAVSITLALLGAGVWAMVWGNIAGVLAGSVIAWIRSGWKPSAVLRAAPLRSIAGFSLNTAAFNATTFALMNADKILVSRSLGAPALGVYSLAQRTINYPMESVAHVLMTVLFPAFSRIQDDNAALRRGYTRALGAIAFLTLPLMVGAATVARPLVEVVLGEEWTDLIPLLWFMAPAGALAALLSAVNTLYSAKGRADWMFRWGLASGAFTLVGFVVGLRWGLVGLAVAYLAVTLIQTPVGLWIVLRLIDMRLSTLLRSLLPYVAMTAAMAAATSGVVAATAGAGAAPWVQLAVGVLTGAVVYGGLAAWVHPPAVADSLTLIRRGER